MKKKSLKINAILNGLKQCFGILFPLITFPYVSRALGEDGFGKYSFSWSIVSYFILLAELGVSTYAIREGAGMRDNKEKLEKFCSEVFTINAITTGVSLLFLLLLAGINAHIHNYFPLVLIQSSALLLNLVGRDWINAIYEDYLYITVRYLIIQILSVLLMLCLIRTPEDVWKYCIISIIASFGGNIPNIWYLRRYVKPRLLLYPNIKKHLPHLIVLFATSIAITVYVNADITMLGFYFDDSTVGIYSLVSKIYNMIKTVVNAMVIVALPRLTYILGNMPEKYELSLKKITSYIIIILLPVACGLFMLSKEVIMIAGGLAYQSGNIALKLLAGGMILAVLCSFCMNSILIVNRKEKECLRATLIAALLNVILNFIILPTWGMIGAAITTIIAEGVNLFILLWYSKDIVEHSLLDLRNFIQCTIASVTIVVACLVIQSLNYGVIVTFILAFFASVICYSIALMAFKNIYVCEMVIAVLGRFLNKGDKK